MGSHQETRMVKGIKLNTQSDTTTIVDTLPRSTHGNIRIKRGSSTQHSNIFKN